MPQLYIMRHGDALFDAVDAMRSLSKRGHAQAADSAEWVAVHAAGHRVRLLASPIKRAQQTAQYLSAALGVSIEPQSWLMPDTPVSDAVTAWDNLWVASGEAHYWVWVSHMPLVGHLGHYLTEGVGGVSDFFDTAEVACYHADVWAAGCAMQRQRYRPHI